MQTRLGGTSPYHCPTVRTSKDYYAKQEKSAPHQEAGEVSTPSNADRIFGSFRLLGSEKLSFSLFTKRGSHLAEPAKMPDQENNNDDDWVYVYGKGVPPLTKARCNVRLLVDERHARFYAAAAKSEERRAIVDEIMHIVIEHNGGRFLKRQSDGTLVDVEPRVVRAHLQTMFSDKSRVAARRNRQQQLFAVPIASSQPTIAEHSSAQRSLSQLKDDTVASETSNQVDAHHLDGVPPILFESSEGAGSSRRQLLSPVAANTLEHSSAQRSLAQLKDDAPTVTAAWHPEELYLDGDEQTRPSARLTESSDASPLGPNSFTGIPLLENVTRHDVPDKAPFREDAVLSVRGPDFGVGTNEWSFQRIEGSRTRNASSLCHVECFGAPRVAQNQGGRQKRQASETISQAAPLANPYRARREADQANADDEPSDLTAAPTHAPDPLSVSPSPTSQAHRHKDPILRPTVCTQAQAGMPQATLRQQDALPGRRYPQNIICLKGDTNAGHFEAVGDELSPEHSDLVRRPVLDLAVNDFSELKAAPTSSVASPTQANTTVLKHLAAPTAPARAPPKLPTQPHAGNEPASQIRQQSLHSPHPTEAPPNVHQTSIPQPAAGPARGGQPLASVQQNNQVPNTPRRLRIELGDSNSPIVISIEY